jgi:hypothetical protein
VDERRQGVVGQRCVLLQLRQQSDVGGVEID